MKLLTNTWVISILTGCCLALSARADDVAGRASPGVSQLANFGEEDRFRPTTRPALPEATEPPLSTDKNVDTGKPIHEWQRATDDWFGLRPKLDDRGITLQANAVLDSSWDLTGGAHRGSSGVRYLLNANVTMNTERLIGWKGGTFFVNFQNQNGENGATIVGATQGISNIDSDSLTQVSEFWYEQTLWDGKVRLKVGKVDSGTEFARVENGAEFINPSFGFSPTIVGFPSYPNPSTSFNIFLYPAPWLYAGLGIYDAAGSQGIATGPRGPATFGQHGLFCIGEAGIRWGETLHGRAAAGVWRNATRLRRFDDGTDSAATGFYLTLDQMLWRKAPDEKDDTRGLAICAQYGWADQHVSAFEHHLGIGLTWTGAIPGRDADVTGLGATCVHLSEDPGAGFGLHNEVNIELFHKFQILKWLSLKPDLQYIHNPGGVTRQNDAFVATLRIQADF